MLYTQQQYKKNDEKNNFFLVIVNLTTEISGLLMVQIWIKMSPPTKK